MINVYPFLHFFAFLVYSSLLGFLLWKDSKSLLNRICGAILACFVVWSFAYIFVYNLDASKDTVMLFDNISSIGWISFASFFLWFSLVLTEKNEILKIKIIYPAIFILLLFFIYKQWTGFLTADYIKKSWGWENVWSDSIWVYLFFIYSLLFLAIGIYLILNFGRKVKEPIKKKQAKIIFITSIIPVSFSALTDIIFPKLGIPTMIPPLGNVTALIWVSGIVYAIIKYKFMVFTPASAAASIISTMADSLVLLNREGNIISGNKATLDLSGYKKRELEGKSVEVLFMEKDFKNTMLIKAIKGEIIRNHELVFKTKTGDEIPVVFSSSTMLDRAGGIAGIVCIIKDITDRKKAEQTILYEQNLLHALMGNVPDYIYFKDLQKRFVRVNKAEAAYSNIPAEKMIGKTDFDFTPQELAKQAFSDDSLVIETGKSIINKLEKIIHSDTTEHWLSTTKVPWQDREGKTIGLIGISRDITERIRNEKLQQSLYNISQAANAPISLSELYRLIHQEIGTIIDASNFYISLIDEKEDKLYFPYHQNEKDDIFTVIEHFSKSSNIDAYLFRTGKPFLLNYPKIKELIERKELSIEGTVTEESVWLGSPLKVGEKIIGSMVVQSYSNPHLYNDGDIKMFEFCSSQVAMAIQCKLTEEAIHKSQQEFFSLFQSSPEALVHIDENSNILNVNPRFTELFGYTLAEIKGRNINDGMIHSPDMIEEGKTLDNLASSKGYFNHESIRKKKDGTLFPVSISGASIVINGQVKGLIGTVIDITERKKMEQELERLAHYDVLTGCYSRGYGFNLMEEQLKLAKRKKTPILLLYLDVDNFKYINDTFGHQEGDKVLEEAVKLFKSTIREIDIVCRLGGDEFLLIFPENSLNDAPAIRDRLNNNLKELNQYLNKPYQIDFSIGLSYYDPTNPKPLDELIRIADEEMYEYKKNKKK